MPGKTSTVSGNNQETKTLAKKELETPSFNQENTIQMLITQVIEKNLSMDVLDRILAMREKLKAEFAKEQFDIAMAYFQGHCPVIEKIKGGGKTKDAKEPTYYYAPLDHIIHTVQPLLDETGLSYTFDTKNEGARVVARCIVRHRSGHREETSVDLAKSSGTQLMSPTQVEAANMTFARRYAFCNAFGIVTGGEDSDAQETTPDIRAVQTVYTQGPGGGAGSTGGERVGSGGTGGRGEGEVVNCTECSNLINEAAVVAFSMAKFKRPVCRSCQANIS